MDRDIKNAYQTRLRRLNTQILLKSKLQNISYNWLFTDKYWTWHVSSVCLQPLQVSPEVTFVSSVTVLAQSTTLSLLCVPLCVCLSMIVCFLFDVCFILFFCCCCCFCWVLLTQLLRGWLILILTLLIKGLFFQVISICPSAGETASGQHAG